MKKKPILIPNHKPKSSKTILTLLFLFFIFQAFSNTDSLNIPPPTHLPVKVSVKLMINKIYDINTQHETFKMDGYLEYKWLDEREKFTAIDTQDFDEMTTTGRAVFLKIGYSWLW